MHAALVCGSLCGLGGIGLVRAVVPARPTLTAQGQRGTGRAGLAGGLSWVIGVPAGMGGAMLARAARWGLGNSRVLTQVSAACAVCDQSLDVVVVQALRAVGVAVLMPPIVWAVVAAAGIHPPVVLLAALVVLLVPAALCLPVAVLFRDAQRRRHHVRVVVASFVDLVVLGLAGGVGVEGALQAASLVGTDWASARIARALALARDAGESPWMALGRLGGHLGVPELVELSATIELAGTEGTRIQTSLRARAGALRRHEQADAERAANTMTERLFVPGALLLVGFLIFIGYPAFSRIIGGF